ncbi:acyltransferase [Candidatus Gottesmanbacteria bacterium]|nr:acyltransferase [Candidatus Gottesmanbacteria bacterium]
MFTIRSLRAFYINRFLRIAPAYYASILLCIFVFYPHVPLAPFDLFRFFTFTANMQYFSLPYQQLLVIISTQMQFYLAAPIFFLVLRAAIRKIHPVVIGISILVLGALVRYLFASAGLVTDLPSYMIHIYVTVWGMIDYFLFGMFISSLRPKTFRFPPVIGYFLFFIFFCAISYTNYYGLSWNSYAVLHHYIIPPVLCVLIGWYILSARVEVPILSSIGKYSYGLYLYHFIFFDLLYRLPNHIDTSIIGFVYRFVTVLFLSGIMALASYYFIERLLRSYRSR